MQRAVRSIEGPSAIDRVFKGKPAEERPSRSMFPERARKVDAQPSEAARRFIDCVATIACRNRFVAAQALSWRTHRRRLGYSICALAATMTHPLDLTY
jgi:hypothetical protein